MVICACARELSSRIPVINAHRHHIIRCFIADNEPRYLGSVRIILTHPSKLDKYVVNYLESWCIPMCWIGMRILNGRKESYCTAMDMNEAAEVYWSGKY